MITSTTGDLPLLNHLGETQGALATGGVACPNCHNRRGVAPAMRSSRTEVHADPVFLLLLCLWAPLALFLGENGFMAGGGLLLGWSGISALRRMRLQDPLDDDPTVH